MGKDEWVSLDLHLTTWPIPLHGDGPIEEVGGAPRLPEGSHEVSVHVAGLLAACLDFQGIQFIFANSNPQNQMNCCSQIIKAEKRMLLYNKFGSREGCFWSGSREGCFCTTGNMFLNRLVCF